MAIPHNDLIEELVREIRTIVRAEEFAQIDVYQGLLPVAERARINAEAEREEEESLKLAHGGLSVGVEVRRLQKIEETFASIYESIRQLAWTGIKNLCEKEIAAATEKLAETEFLKDGFARAIDNWDPSNRAAAFASVIASLPNKISVSRVYELLRQMVDPQRSLWRLRHKPQDYHLLRRLALDLSALLSQAVWGDKPVEVYGPLYYPLFGLQYGMRIKEACRSLRPYEIFSILGSHFARFMSWTGRFPEEERRRFENIFAQLLKASIVNEISAASDWRSLRQIAMHLDRQRVTSYASQLLGSTKASQLSNWIDRAKNLMPTDCSPEMIRELVDDFDSLKSRTIDIHHIVDQMLEELGLGLVKDYFGPLYAMNYYAAVLVQELAEREIGSSGDEWKAWELCWKLSSLRLLR